MFLILLAVLPAAVFGLEPGEVQFFKENPELLNVSTLSLEVDKTIKELKRPHLGAFGIGGLNAFTMLGLSYPLNTYHNTTTYYHPFFGYPTYVSSAPLKEFYSLDSSLAFAVAARGMEELAEKLGKNDDGKKYAELRERVEAAIEKYYRMDEGDYATGLRKDNLAPLPRMFPLISLNPAVIGYEKNEARLKRNLTKTISELRRKDGSLQMAKGVGLYHGQLQGTFLYNLKSFNHPLAERVFDLLIHKISDPAGMFSEVHANNHSHMSMSVEPTGRGKEDARRFGPWESALNISSLVYYLTGMEVDAGKMEVSLIPELPKGWNRWEMRDGMIKQNRFDFSVEDSGDTLTYSFDNRGPETISVLLDLPIGNRKPARVLINGEGQPLTAFSIEKTEVGMFIKGIKREVEKELAVQVEYK